ncbi:Phosphate starvation-inducible protein PhoH [Petrocella atlantisensis]|uniref:Phosphate starvation-inducible protein PhoH n=1 Tax=Petrocella atlantisensis TaxID=2173034 RepID=A0A3P7PUN9_9FIRM|nr:PhoH family protein [Petrocella atlantisensis]PKM54803.1 MAG: phosphate starvation-inducible protein PhoH [Firmicutes bacterium HGW-Firmicutes-5]VDN47667.1 Phosphate starvation-inducible protein PhoH [Petrocella atlantisensis]
MVKNYVIDTNVMIHDPKFMYKFSDNNVIIPILCIEELDNLKKRDGLVGFHARHVAKELQTLMSKGNISEGIALENGGIVKVEQNYLDTEVLPNGVDLSKNDSKIIAVVKNLQNANQDIKTILVTKDVYMHIKASSLGIEVQDFENDKIDNDQIYTGYADVEWPSEMIDAIYAGGFVPEDTIKQKYHPNQFLHIKSSNRSGHEVLARFDGQKIVPLKYVNETAWGLTPINREQKMAFELLMNPDIHFVTITGGAGSGKTILSTAAALQNVIESNRYRKIVFVRPVVPAGEDIGYLPGTEVEKLKPWMGSFYDAIENLTDLKDLNKESQKEQRYNSQKPTFTVDDFIDQYRQRGIIETKTFTYMRGRTFTNSFIIVDEAQEMTPHLAKLMLTRAGHNSKFIFLGDPSDNQIDNHYVDARSNGLIYTVEKMKAFGITGHVTLKRVERSPLAEVAERNM